MLPETGAPHAAHFQQPAVSCATSADSLSFCIVPCSLASWLFLASLPPGPGAGHDSATPGEPVRLCMVPVLAQAFLSLRTARIHVTSSPQQSFAILVLSTGATASA